MKLLTVWSSTLLALALPGLAFAENTDEDDDDGFRLRRIWNVIVIYQENWSFDSLYGRFPGADGVEPNEPIVQLPKMGTTPLTVVPQPINTDVNPPVVDARFPGPLPVTFYDLSTYVPSTQDTGDIIHRFYHEQLQIDHGAMDRFVSWSDNGGLVLSYYDASSLPEGQLARQFVLCDHCFHSAFGGSFLNHQWLIAAQSPRWEGGATKPIPASFPSNANPAALADNQATPDGQYLINTVYSENTPHPASQPFAKLVPNLTNATIGDRLEDAHVGWAWYAGGWNDAVSGHADPTFQFHHQPFVYYRRYADGTHKKQEHLKDEQDFLAALASNTLPEVAFVKPLGVNNEHPGYADLQRGQRHVADLVSAVRASNYWEHCAIVITYDENGGRWDHVAPPIMDGWGPGTRVPMIVVSPFSKRGFVDHTTYETVSILRLIEQRWHLQPLSERDAHAGDLRHVFGAVHRERNNHHHG